jgi:hypothetical protein
MKTLKSSLVGLLFASLALAAEAPTVIQEATGQAAIVKGDELKAKDEAIKNALRTAVEQAAGVLITSDTVTLNSQLVRDRVYSKSSGYVKNHSVVSQKAEKGVLTVVVKAEVLTSQLDKDLESVRDLVKKISHSRLLIVTQEQAIDNKGIVQRSEILSAKLVSAFRNDGWKIKDEKSTVFDGAMKVSSGVGTGQLDAKEIGRKSDVDYILYGSINMRFLAPTPGSGFVPEVDSLTGKQLIFFVVGDYELSIFETRTGTNLGKTANKMAFKAGGGDFIKEAAKFSKGYEESANVLSGMEAPRIVNELRTHVIEFIRNRDVNGYELDVVVKGLSDFAAAQDFKKALAAMKDVKEVRSRDFKGGVAQYEVSFLGNAEDFSNAIGSTTSFQKKTVKVSGMEHNTVEVSIGK